jgi:hypothetical protein
MSSKHLGLKIRKEDAKDILREFIDILRVFIVFLFISLSCSVIIRISKDVYIIVLAVLVTFPLLVWYMYDELPDKK